MITALLLAYFYELPRLDWYVVAPLIVIIEFLELSLISRCRDEDL